MAMTLEQIDFALSELTPKESAGEMRESLARMREEGVLDSLLAELRARDQRLCKRMESFILHVETS